MTQKEIVLLTVEREPYPWEAAREACAHGELLWRCWWAAAFAPAGAEITAVWGEKGIRFGIGA